VELLEKRLPDIGNGHLASNSDFHVNSLNVITSNIAYTFIIQSLVQYDKFRNYRISQMQQ
jgi:hypothetical protein